MMWNKRSWWQVLQQPPDGEIWNGRKVADWMSELKGYKESQILRLAKIYQADLIAIGCRGLTGLKRIFEGSVSAEVVAEAPCSVLVVRSR